MRILKREVLAKYKDIRITRLIVKAPFIAKKASAGQFVILMVKEDGERIPLTIVDKDVRSGSITLIFQEIGYTTKLLGRLKKGSSLYALLGPLGKPTEVRNWEKVLVIGGGVGIAEVYPVVKAFRSAGCTITVILGARTKSLLILEKEIAKYAHTLYISTDDGTYGQKGFVTDILKRLLKEKSFNLIYCVGPILMMKAVASISKQYNIKTTVSLNAIMLDGTGMCGSCRVKEKGKIKLCCLDGPDFDAWEIDFDELLQRQNRFRDKEKMLLQQLKITGKD